MEPPLVWSSLFGYNRRMSGLRQHVMVRRRRRRTSRIDKWSSFHNLLYFDQKLMRACSTMMRAPEPATALI